MAGRRLGEPASAVPVPLRSQAASPPARPGGRPLEADVIPNDSHIYLSKPPWQGCRTIFKNPTSFLARSPGMCAFPKWTSFLP